MKPLITVNNLCMDFDGKKVLKNISFEIGEGEILGIIGRSGAGKTVLMHLLRGVEQPPTSGQIIYHVAVCDSCPYVGVGAWQENPARRAERFSGNGTSTSGTRKTRTFTAG